MATPGLSARLQLGDYVGRTAPPPFPLNVSALKAFLVAQKQGRVSGLRAVRVKKDETSERDAPAIAPDYKAIYPSAMNAKTAFGVQTGTATYLEEAPAPLVPDSSGLWWTDGRPNQAAQLITLPQSGGLNIPDTTGFAVRFWLPRPPDTQKSPCFALRWGNGSKWWQLQILDGKFEAQRLKSTFTQADENALFDLLAIEQPTPSEQTDIDDLRIQLYSSRESLNLGAGSKNMYAAVQEIVIDPEGSGIINFDLQGAGSESVKVQEIVSSIGFGSLWRETPLTIRSNGGGFVFQVGYPVFPYGDTSSDPDYLTTASMHYGPLQIRDANGYIYQPESFGDLVTNSLVWAPSGTGVVYRDVMPEDDETSMDVVLQWVSNNPRQAARLYAFDAYLSPGDRSQTESEPWDSEQHLSDGLFSPFEEIDVQFEGESRRRQFTAKIINPYGEILDQNPAHRTCTLDIRGARMLTEGFVKDTEWTGLQDTAGTSAPSNLNNRGRTSVTLCDWWGIFEEIELDTFPVCNSLYLSEVFRRCLKIAGVADGRIALSETGILLPPRIPGESNGEIRPNGGTLANFMRRMQDEWGMGARLFQKSDGDWDFAFPSAQIMARFRKDSDYTNPHEPGISRILDGLDQTESLDDFANCFRVTGGEGADGLPIVREAKFGESVTNSDAATFVGREIWKKVDAGYLRRAQYVEWMLRSLWTNLYLPPRYYGFMSHFHTNLFPMDRVTVNDRLCKVSKIPSGSINKEQGRMKFVCRRLA